MPVERRLFQDDGNRSLAAMAFDADFCLRVGRREQLTTFTSVVEDACEKCKLFRVFLCVLYCSY